MCLFMQMSLQGAIEEKIRAAFAPIHLEVVNESHKHNVPRDSETHFKVLVVSELFEGKKIMEQHRMVNNVLEVCLFHRDFPFQLVTPPNQLVVRACPAG